jgi:AraC family transcriptional regulator
LGFTLLEDKKEKLVKETKGLMAEVYSGSFDFPTRFRFSELAARRLQKDYDTISATFSAVENTTLEKYIIDFRIEKVKEFLVYTPQTLGDISFRLGFSSVAHLSRQFKEITGINPSYFKSIRVQKEHLSQSA